MKKLFLTFLCFIFIPPAHAATSVPFTIAMNEVVNVTGIPRIAVDVGGVTRYADYSGGTGTSTLIFTYTMVSGDVDNDGVVLSSPIDLNGGTIMDNAGNPATLTFTPPDTSGVLINAAVPSGYTAAFMDDTVTNVNKTNFGFTLNYNKANKTIHYSIASSGGGSPITGTATTTGAAQNITGLNVSALPDGKLTLSVYLTDAIGGTGATVTDTAPMAVLDSSLVGHWTFDANDISGITAFDRSGNSYNTFIDDGPTFINGVVGGAISFDGQNDKLRSMVSDPFEYRGIGGFTISAWIYSNDLDNGKVISKAWNGSGQYNWRVDLTSTSIALHLSGQTAYVISHSVNLNSQWAFISFTISNSGLVTLYLNGVSQTSGNSTILDWTPSLGDNNVALCIGSIYPYPAGWPGNAGYSFLGQIDDVRIYNRALTPAEITTLYNSGF